MSRYLPVCDGVITPVASWVQCTGGAGWISVDATYLPGQFDLTMLDPAACSAAYAAGFVLVGGVLLVARAVRFLLEAIRVF